MPTIITLSPRISTLHLGITMSVQVISTRFAREPRTILREVFSEGTSGLWRLSQAR
jgi:hypothetical protein